MNENQTISEKELLDAIKNLLRKNGHLNKFQAEMRAKVTEILQEQQMSRNPGMKTAGDAPKPTDEVLLINELVREYLEWNGYLYTAGVLSAEAALPAARAPRAALCAAVGVRDDERSAALPLLANVLAAYAERVKRKINKSKKEND